MPQDVSVINGASNGNNEPLSKKRKLDEPATTHPTHTATDKQRRVLLEARDISFSLPQRKKLHLGLVQYGSKLDEKGSTFAIQARNPATNQVEFECPMSAFAHALRVPVPEKAQKQYNFCLLPASDSGAATEAVIWTVNHGPLKSCHIHDPELVKGTDDVLEQALDFVMQQTGGKLIMPSDDQFASSLRESHRKADVAYHVKAFRGSKEGTFTLLYCALINSLTSPGYLFFLSTGIFFGFKKPLLFFPFSDIESVSYTSVLQRTFNMNVLVRLGPEEAPSEIEFSMLDQADFAGIDGYVKKHQLQDASLAEARRAKKVGKVNGGKNASTETEDDDGRTELEKAEQELEDEEDEMEEDYDPDEDGDEDGSESDSEDEDADYSRGKGTDLVAAELGSEAEDVSQSEDEEAEDEDDDEGEEGEQTTNDPPPKTNPPPITALPVDTHQRSRIDHAAPSLDDDDQL